LRAGIKKRANGGPLEKETVGEQFSLWSWQGPGGPASVRVIADLRPYTVRPEVVTIIQVNGQSRILFGEDRFRAVGYGTRNQPSDILSHPLADQRAITPWPSISPPNNVVTCPSLVAAFLPPRHPRSARAVRGVEIDQGRGGARPYQCGVEVDQGRRGSLPYRCTRGRHLR